MIWKYSFPHSYLCYIYIILSDLTQNISEHIRENVSQFPSTIKLPSNYTNTGKRIVGWSTLKIKQNMNSEYENIVLKYEYKYKFEETIWNKI